METVGVHGGYKYYAEKVGEQRIWVPDDVIPISEEHGKEPYRDFTKYDLYRVSILQENATPELVAQGIAEYGVTDRYVYYLDFAPEYRGSHWVATDFTKQGADIVSHYAFDDPSVPEGAALRNIFREDYGPLHILDTVTLEQVATLDSEECYMDIHTLEFMGKGVFAVFKNADDLSMRTESLTGYLYFNKPLLDETDLFVFDLSSEPGL